MKLGASGFKERKAVAVYGFEHSPPRIELEKAVRAFEVIAKEVVAIRLGAREEALFAELIYPVHQQGRIYGWEVRADSLTDVGQERA
jgi:hypothetical protein